MDISLASLILVLLVFLLPLLYLLLPLPGKRSGGGGDGLKSPPSPAGCLPLLGHLAHANAVVSRAAFGDESARGLYGGADGGRALRKVFSDFSQLLGTKPVRDLLPWLGWVDTLRGLERKVRRTFEALDGVLDKVIDDHRRRRRESGRQTCDAADQRDFVDVLLDVNEMDNEAGIQLDPIEIKAIVMDMFVAGSDATSTPMEWAMAELVSHPRHMRRLQDEIRAVVGDAGRRVTEDHIDKLPYLTAVLKETLRLHAPLPLLLPRETVADTEIMGYHVAARTRVVINGWAIGRDTAVWGEAAEEFMPERFLAGGGGGGGAAADYKGQGFEMLPFGGGRRGCPGVTFGMATVEMAVASLLYHFDWAAAAANGKGCREEGMPSLDMSETSGISLGIKHGLPLVAKPRFP